MGFLRYFRRDIKRAGQAFPASLDLFTLQTGRGTWLVVERKAGVREVAMAETAVADDAIILCMPRGAPQNAALIASDGRPISVEGDGFAGPAVTGRVRWLPDGRIELRHPVAPVRHLGVVTGVPVGKTNRVLFDRVGDPVLDRFRPCAVGEEALTPTSWALVRELALAVQAPMRADALLRLLHARTVRLELAEGLLRLLPADELQVLAQRAMTVPADLALLRDAMPDDPWIGGVLPKLVRWWSDGRAATRRTVSPAAENHVAILQSGELRPPIGLGLAALGRRTVSPRRVAAVLATARNEGPYLLDWLAHHRAVGFEHAVIYSNDNTDGSDDLLGRLADHGVITWVRNELGPQARAQWKAYGHAFKALPDLLDFRWTMVLDLDEYVGFQPGQFGSIADFIGWHEHQHVDAIALRWLIFAGERADIWRDTASVRRFVKREPAVNPMFKSLVRSNQFWDAHCHFPYPTMDLPFSYRLEDGTPCHHMNRLKGISMPKDHPTAEKAWVAHHVYRSAGEALIKAARGDALWASEDRDETARLGIIVRRFMAMADNPNLLEDRRTLHCAPAAPKMLAQLKALPGVGACDAAIKQRFAAQVMAVSQAFAGTDGGKKFEGFLGVLRQGWGEGDPPPSPPVYLKSGAVVEASIQ